MNFSLKGFFLMISVGRKRASLPWNPFPSILPGLPSRQELIVFKPETRHHSFLQSTRTRR
jgi:hypothetical protein